MVVGTPQVAAMKNKILKILIRTPNWLGDSVMSIPAVKGMKKIYPDAELFVWTKPGLKELWNLVPEVNEVIDYVPKKHNFDLGILLTNSFNSALKMRMAKISERRGYSINLRRFLLTQPVHLNKKYKEMHQVDYFLGIIEGLGRERIENVPEIELKNGLKEDAEKILADYGWKKGDKIIGIHATAAYGPAKCWVFERFSRLIDRLIDEYKSWIVLIGSKTEEKGINRILNGIKNKDKVINIAGKTDLKGLSAIISLCDLFIANDSGPMHLASAIGVPVIAIFGSTSSKKTGPRGLGRCVILKKEVPCSPCFERECPKNMECMNLIEVDDVINAVTAVLFSPEQKIDTTAAVVMKDYDESKGGAERYLASLAPNLAERFGSMDLIVNRVNGIVPKGINVKKIYAFRWSSIFSPLSFNWSAQCLIKKNGYGVVYGLTQIYPQDVYRAGGGLEHSWLEIKCRKLWQRVLNYLQPRHIVRLYIENQIFKAGNYKKIITNSNLCKYQILHHYRVNPQDVRVIYNGVDGIKFNVNIKNKYRIGVRADLGIPSEEKVILFMSNNWKRKGLSELIQALALIQRNDIWLIAAGRGNNKRYGNIAEKCNIKNRIIFTGPVNEPEKYYGASDIFVLPTYYDPCANVCLEALKCGLPVITTIMNGASEFITDGKNGFKIEDPKDIRILADCIKKAFSLDMKNIDETVRDLALEKNVQETIDVLQDVKLRESRDILINDGYEQFFKGKGWLNFNDVMREEGGVQYKKNNLRSVVKIDFNGRSVFLKRHFKEACPSWALREWQNIFRLKSLGIATMNPVAMGEKQGMSFIITESLEQYQRLEDLLRKNRLTFDEKKELIYKLAQLIRKLHNNNLFHKDFYTGHIFVKILNGTTGGGYGLYIIDVQRLQRHWLFSAHWRIKDLASLNFSSAEEWISRSDRARFLKYYFAAEDISGKKGFVRKILKKTKQIAGHTEKLLKRRKVL